MQASNTFKRVFLKKLLMGFQVGEFSSENMTLLERKNAIKLSADVALASARDGRNWSRAIIANVLKQEKNNTLAWRILGNEEFERLTTKARLGSLNRKRVLSNKIVRSCKVQRIRKRLPQPQRLLAGAVAKKMVKKRTQVLKGLIPGGESMDRLCLLDETVDYIISLKAQVDVMRRLANAVQRLNHKVI